MNKDTIEIARSYSRTIQLEPFTPTNVFMSAKAEITDNDVDAIKVLSSELYNFCKGTVDSDIEKLIVEKEKKEKIVKELS